MGNFVDNFSGTLAAWTTWGGSWSIVGGRLRHTTAASASGMTGVLAYEEKKFLHPDVRISLHDFDTGPRGGLLLRGTQNGVSGVGYAVRILHQFDAVIVSTHLANGTFGATRFIDYTHPGSLIDLPIRVVMGAGASGPTFTLYVDGVEVASGEDTDNTFPDPGYVGIAHLNGGDDTCEFDDFALIDLDAIAAGTPRMNNWWSFFFMSPDPGGGGAVTLDMDVSVTSATNTPSLRLDLPLALAGAVESATNTPVLSLAQDLAVAVVVASSTNTPNAEVDRALALAVAVASVTGDAPATVLRDLSLGITVSSETSAAELVTDGTLAAAFSVTSLTGDAPLAALRGLTLGIAAASSTNAPVAAVNKSLTMSVTIASATGDSLLSVLRDLSLGVTVNTETGAASLVTGVPLDADVTVTTQTGAAPLAALRGLTLGIAAASSTNAPAAAVSRALALAVTVATAVDAALEVEYVLGAGIQVNSATSATLTVTLLELPGPHYRVTQEVNLFRSVQVPPVVLRRTQDAATVIRVAAEGS